MSPARRLLLLRTAYTHTLASSPELAFRMLSRLGAAS
jgi:hypothetical protein